MKKLLVVIAALLLWAGPSYAQKTKAQINTEIPTLLPDNTSGQITPLGLRTLTSDITNSIMPTAPVVSGNLACFSGTTGLLQDCGVYSGFLQGGTGATTRTWQDKNRDTLNGKDFGMLCNGATDDAPALQLALNAAAASGKILLLPPGQCFLNAGVSVSEPVIMRGTGMGAGPGAVENGPTTQLVPTFASGNIITATSIYGFTFEDFQINSAVGQRTGGSAIFITGTGAGTVNTASIVRRVAFSNQFIDITCQYCSRETITNTYHQAWKSVAYYGTSNLTNETGSGEIYNNFFFGEVTPATTQQAAVYLEHGYTNVHNNLFVGAQATVEFNIQFFPAGNPVVQNNVIENSVTYGVLVRNNAVAGVGVVADTVQIIGNEFKATGADSGATLQAHVYIEANAGTGGAWIDNVLVSQNTFRSQLTWATGPNYVQVKSGNRVLISDNLIGTISGDTAKGFVVGSEATAVTISNNKFGGSGSGAKYGTLTTATTVMDPDGFTFATLPATLANGSLIWCSDCLVSSNPATASGSGSYVFRENGAWVARSGLAANQVGNAQLRQSGALSLIGRSANSTGNVADILASAASDCVFRESSSTVGCGTVATGGIAANAVTLTKLATQADQTVLGNVFGSTAAPSALTRTQLTTLLAGGSAFTQGSVLFAGASGLLSQDNANFFWDGTNHKLGIGTTTLAAGSKLTVANGADTATTFIVTGLTKGLRFGTTAAGSQLEGVDSTGSLSYQPFSFGGSFITAAIAGSETARFTANGGFVVGLTTDPGAGVISANAGYKITTKLAWSATAPTVSSGFCTSPSISNSNGTAAFTVTIGSACAASTGVLTMPTANAGWACNFRNVTNNAANAPSQTASTVTSVSVTNYVRTTGVAGNWTASDVIVVDCAAY